MIYKRVICATHHHLRWMIATLIFFLVMPFSFLSLVRGSDWWYLMPRGISQIFLVKLEILPNTIYLLSCFNFSLFSCKNIFLRKKDPNKKNCLLISTTMLLRKVSVKTGCIGIFFHTIWCIFYMQHVFRKISGESNVSAWTFSGARIRIE